MRLEIRTARERFTGAQLSQELSRIQNRLDTVDLLTPDIIINLLLSYRDVQVSLLGQSEALSVTACGPANQGVRAETASW